MRKLWAGLAVLLAVGMMVGCSGTSDELESKANSIMKTVFGPCFKPIYDGDLAEASVVETSGETDGVVTVKVFLTSISTGEDTTYEFRVNTGDDFRGPPAPGSGIPLNDEATQLTVDC